MACDIEVTNRLRDEYNLDCPSRLEYGLSQFAENFAGQCAEEIYDLLASLKKVKIQKSKIDQHPDGYAQALRGTVPEQRDISNIAKTSQQRCTGDKYSDASEDGKSDEEKEGHGDGGMSTLEESGRQGINDGVKEPSGGHDGAKDSISASESSSFNALDDVREVVDMVRNAVENSRLTSGKDGTGIGDIPGCVEELLASLMAPSLDWRTLLGDYVTKCHAAQRRWHPSSRRHIWRGVYLPSIRCERLNAVVAMDTSGSTRAYIERFFSEMLGIIQSVCQQYEITMIECDCAIQNVQILTEFSRAGNLRWKCHGMGGTDFNPVFDYVHDKGLVPDVMVFFTDGMGNAPDEAPDYPVIWCLPDADGMTRPCDWGKEIRIPIDSLTQHNPR